MLSSSPSCIQTLRCRKQRNVEESLTVLHTARESPPCIVQSHRCGQYFSMLMCANKHGNPLHDAEGMRTEHSRKLRCVRSAEDTSGTCQTQGQHPCCPCPRSNCLTKTATHRWTHPVSHSSCEKCQRILNLFLCLAQVGLNARQPLLKHCNEVTLLPGMRERTPGCRRQGVRNAAERATALRSPASEKSLCVV